MEKAGETASTVEETGRAAEKKQNKSVRFYKNQTKYVITMCQRDKNSQVNENL